MIGNQNNSLRILITAGPTHEPIDAVRYLGNRSSGRLGLALAERSAVRGHETTLLLGPTSLSPPDPSPFSILRFQAAADLQALLLEQWPKHDLLIMAAAVSDFRPILPDSTSKIRRSDAGLRLDLEPTPDLLAMLASLTQPHQTTIGFALEPDEGLIEAALRKMKQKKLDAIVANPLATMDSQVIDATLLFRDGRRMSPPEALSKIRFADWLLDHLPFVIEAAHPQAPGG